MSLSKKDDDYHELESIPISAEEEDVVPPDEFVRQIYAIAKKERMRGDAGVYESDLLYNTILCEKQGMRWLPRDHPVALMLYENNALSGGQYEVAGDSNSPLGNIVVYSEDMVQECLEALIDLCRDSDLKTLEEPQEIKIDK